MAWSLSSAGLVAPASYSASGNANTLDDYEEGTQTWAMAADSGANYQPRAGYTLTSYTKIGMLCHMSGRYETQGTDQSSGQSCRFSLPLAVRTGGQATEYSVYSTNFVVRGHGVSGNSFTTGYITWVIVSDSGVTGAAVWAIDNSSGNIETLLVGQSGSGTFEWDNAFEGTVSICYPVA